MLYILLSLIWVHLLINQWFKQTLCVSYFTKVIWVTVGIGPWFGVHFVMDQWIKYTLCVCYFIGYNLGSFGDLTVIKMDTMCYPNYWVNMGYSRWLTSDKIRHFVLAILISVFLVRSLIEHWLKQTLCLSYFTGFIWFTLGIGPWSWVQSVIDHWIKQALYVRYFTGYKYGTFINLHVIK